MKESGQRYKNIVLADDDSDDRDLFLEAINLIDPTITVVLKRDGEELMDYLNETSARFDLIFLDLNMPRKNGKECLAEIRKSSQHARSPVIVYTTSLNPVDIEETYVLGASFFLRKPNSFEELKQTLSIVLTNKFATTENSKERFVIQKTVNPVPNL